MTCEERILRVLRTLEYPGLYNPSPKGSESVPALGLAARPDELAKIVTWIEDRKVRGLAIPDREPLRHPGPKWEAAFFSYLQEMGCPYDFDPGAGSGTEPRSSLVLTGLSWLVTEAVACDFEDNGTDYIASARQLLSKNPPPPPTAESGLARPVDAADDDVVAMDDGSGGGRARLHELEGFSAGVETGDAACDSVATVLRMLFLSDLRGLQDEVNGIIALAQSGRTEQI